MATEVKAFVCDFCPRKHRFAGAGYARRHELRCYFNPAMKACVTCKHFSVEKPYRDMESGYTEDGGRFCDIDYFNTAPGESELRSECDKWEAKGEQQ